MKKAMLFAASVLLFAACTGEPQLGKAPLDKVLRAMTLEEKVHFLIGNGMAGFEDDFREHILQFFRLEMERVVGGDEGGIVFVRAREKAVVDVAEDVTRVSLERCKIILHCTLTSPARTFL